MGGRSSRATTCCRSSPTSEGRAPVESRDTWRSERRDMATVTRVLPWRRNSVPPAEEVAPLVAAFRSHHPKASSVMITRAYELAADAHRQQVRKSGESYIYHPLAVAAIVADLG